MWSSAGFPDSVVAGAPKMTKESQKGVIISGTASSAAAGSSVLVPSVGAPTEMPGSAGLAALNVVDILHAIRRRGAICLVLALPLACAAGVVTWRMQSPTYEAGAVLELSETGTHMVFSEIEAVERYELFQGTQKLLAQSRLVISAALRDQQVANLETMRHFENPIEWIRKRLRIMTWENTELMGIRICTKNPEDCVVLVNAVADAYMDEVVNLEQKTKQERLTRIDQLDLEKQNELRQERESLRELAERLGSGDPAALSAKLQILLQETSLFRSQANRIREELWRRKGDLQATQNRLDSPENGLVTRLDFERTVAADPIYQELIQARGRAALMQADAGSAFRKRIGDQFVKSNDQLLSGLDRQIAGRKKDIEKELLQSDSLAVAETQAAVDAAESDVKLLSELLEHIEKEITGLSTRIEELGTTSVDVEMKRDAIEQLANVRERIAEDMEKLRVELNSRPRVKVIEYAETAELANWTTRIALTGLAALAMLVTPAAIVLFRDASKRKVNSSGDLTRIDVIGSLPLVPRGAVRRAPGSGRLGRRHRFWQMVLSESVARVASLLVNAPGESAPRALLVTSAVSGEGKTTLATQLSLSLARAGRRVILVDTDFRRPMLHKVFDLPRSPGFRELLAGEADIVETLRDSNTHNLRIIPCGSRDSLAPELLRQESAASVFREIRSLCDFVIYDSGPVLLLADSSFIGARVDAALMAVRRDVSRLTQIEDARDSLLRLGIRFVGAVVTEPRNSDYGDYYGYMSASGE